MGMDGVCLPLGCVRVSFARIFGPTAQVGTPAYCPFSVNLTPNPHRGRPAVGFPGRLFFFFLFVHNTSQGCLLFPSPRVSPVVLVAGPRSEGRAL